MLMDGKSCFSLYVYKFDHVFCKDVNEYLNRYSNIRKGIQIIFEYSMVNNSIFPL